MLANKAAWYSVAFMYKGALNCSQSQCAKPMWSGCMWVTTTRKMGRPFMGPANTWPQASCVPGLVTPQSTAVQPCRKPDGVSSVSAKSHKLMWSNANGKAMRSQRMPGATSKAWPNSGKVVPRGKVRAFSPAIRSAALTFGLGVAVWFMSILGCGKNPADN